MPAISVIIPVYNTPLPYFHECIQSILAQSFTDYEVWLIDDGSTNGVEKICDEYTRNDGRFKVIHQKNQGLSAARNEGIRQALESLSKYMIFLDSDDWWEEDTLFSLYEKAESECLDVLVFGYYVNSENKQEEVRNFPKKEIGEFVLASPEFKGQMQRAMLNNKECGLPACTGSACTQLIGKNLIKRQQLRFEEKIRVSEDILFNWKLWESAERMGCWEEVYYHYRMHSNSATKRYWSNKAYDFDLFNKEILRFLEEEKREEPFFHAYDMWLFWGYFISICNDINHSDNPKSLKERKVDWNNLPQRCSSFQRLKTVKWKWKYPAERLLCFAAFQCESWSLFQFAVLIYKAKCKIGR